MVMPSSASLFEQTGSRAARSVHSHSVCIVACGGGCAPVESSAGIGFAACAGKHYFVIGTKAAFGRTSSVKGSRREPRRHASICMQRRQSPPRCSGAVIRSQDASTGRRPVRATTVHCDNQLLMAANCARLAADPSCNRENSAGLRDRPDNSSNAQQLVDCRW